MKEKNDKEQLEIVRQTCLDAAINIAVLLNKEINNSEIMQLSNAFVRWCYKDGKNQQILIKRQSALKRAVSNASNKGSNITDSKSLLTCAQEFYDYIIQ